MLCIVHFSGQHSLSHAAAPCAPLSKPQTCATTRATEHRPRVTALLSPVLRVLANHLPVGLDSSSGTEPLRHIRVPIHESGGQRRGAILAGYVDVHSQRS